MMEFIKRYRLSIILAILLGVLIIIRSSGTRNFRYDAQRWAEPSLTASNIVTYESASSLKGEILVVTFDPEETIRSGKTWKKVTIPSDSILVKKYRKTIEKHKGPVLLYDTDNSVPARIWMMLSQKGIKNLYILTSDSDNEVMKEKFRTDTLTGPELK